MANKVNQKKINDVLWRGYDTFRGGNATIKEIAENDFNLNMLRYVNTFEAEEQIDIDAVQQKIDGIEAELTKTRKQMAMYLKERSHGT